MALPRQRRGGSDVEFSHRLEEYRRKERVRDKARSIISRVFSAGIARTLFAGSVMTWQL